MLFKFFKVDSSPYNMIKLDGKKRYVVVILIFHTDLQLCVWSLSQINTGQKVLAKVHNISTDILVSNKELVAPELTKL